MAAQVLRPTRCSHCGLLVATAALTLSCTAAFLRPFALLRPSATVVMSGKDFADAGPTPADFERAFADRSRSGGGFWNGKPAVNLPLELLRRAATLARELSPPRPGPSAALDALPAERARPEVLALAERTQRDGSGSSEEFQGPLLEPRSAVAPDPAATVTSGRLLVLSEGGATIVTCDASGGSVRRLFPQPSEASKGRNDRLATRKATAAAGGHWQVQHPVWSPDGSLVAFVVLSLQGEEAPSLHGGTATGAGTGRRSSRKPSSSSSSSSYGRNGIAFEGGSGGSGVTSRQKTAVPLARLIVVKEATGERVASARLPQPPFHLEWAPDGKGMSLLCDDGEGLAQLMEVKLSGTDVAAATEASSSSETAQLRARVLDRGGPLYYATIAASNERPASSSSELSAVSSSAWLVAHNGAHGGVCVWQDSTSSWQRIGTAKVVQAAAAAAAGQKQPNQRYKPQFRAPQPHSAGGAASVLFIEEGWLVSARVDGSAVRQIIELPRAMARFAMAVSPDSGTACVLAQDGDSSGGRGGSILSLIGSRNLKAVSSTSASSLDAAGTGAIEVREVALDGQPLGFWFSPDSSKLLVLQGPSQQQQQPRTPSLRCQWLVIEVNTNRPPQRYSRDFRPRPYWSKVYLSHFDQASRASSLWAPDSSAFAYAGEDGAFVQKLAVGGSNELPLSVGLARDAELVGWTWRP